MKRRLAVIGIMVVAALALTGCFPPTVPIVDPDNPDAPIARISSDPNVSFGDEILFNGGASYDPDGGDIEYGYWDFGDGNSVEGGWTTTSGDGPVIYVKHAYTVQTGSYTVSLLVRDDEGSLGRTTRNVIVED